LEDLCQMCRRVCRLFFRRRHVHGDVPLHAHSQELASLAGSGR
jgi:hypothetical protein